MNASRPAEHPQQGFFVVVVLFVVRALCFFFKVNFLRTSSVGGGGGATLPDFLSFVLFSLFSRSLAGLTTV